MDSQPPPPKRLGRNSRIVRVSSQPLDVAIGAFAAKHQGNITRRHLVELGLSDDAIRYRVKAGRLYREHHGVYSVGRRATTALERASAAVLACGPGAALSHASAMALWGFWRRWDQPFEVTVPGDRRHPGIRVHRSRTLSWRDVRRQLGIHVTSPARTFIDTTPRLSDKELKRALSNALHSPWLTESQLEETLSRHAGHPAVRRIAPLIGLPGTPPRAGWEHDFPAFCQSHGLPTPVMGAPLLGYIVDALFVEEKVIVELDSWAFHKDPIAFRADRERDAETLAHGFVTIRITWDRIQLAPAREAARLGKVLARRRAALERGQALGST